MSITKNVTPTAVIIEPHTYSRVATSHKPQMITSDCHEKRWSKNAGDNNP